VGHSVARMILQMWRQSDYDYGNWDKKGRSLIPAPFLARHLSGCHLREGFQLLRWSSQSRMGSFKRLHDERCEHC